MKYIKKVFIRQPCGFCLLPLTAKEGPSSPIVPLLLSFCACRLTLFSLKFIILYLHLIRLLERSQSGNHFHGPLIWVEAVVDFQRFDVDQVALF